MGECVVCRYRLSVIWPHVPLYIRLVSFSRTEKSHTMMMSQNQVESTRSTNTNTVTHTCQQNHRTSHTHPIRTHTKLQPPPPPLFWQYFKPYHQTFGTFQDFKDRFESRCFTLCLSQMFENENLRNWSFKNISTQFDDSDRLWKKVQEKRRWMR